METQHGQLTENTKIDLPLPRILVASNRIGSQSQLTLELHRFGGGREAFIPVGQAPPLVRKAVRVQQVDATPSE
jgi:hypothetical protein